MSAPSPRPESGPASGWTLDQIKKQAYELAMRVVQERFAQEDRWGPQEVPNLKRLSDGRDETGRPYRQWESIFKYQCDRNRASGHEAMDVIWLEEVFESLAAVVELDDVKHLATSEDLGEQATYVAAKEHVVMELVQAAAVALKWAGIIERTS
jgi:hypothetical protein